MVSVCQGTCDASLPREGADQHSGDHPQAHNCHDRPGRRILDQLAEQPHRPVPAPQAGGLPSPPPPALAIETPQHACPVVDGGWVVRLLRPHERGGHLQHNRVTPRAQRKSADHGGCRVA